MANSHARTPFLGTMGPYTEMGIVAIQESVPGTGIYPRSHSTILGISPGTGPHTCIHLRVCEQAITFLYHIRQVRTVNVIRVQIHDMIHLLITFPS